jgi:hypothetical protein
MMVLREGRIAALHGNGGNDASQNNYTEQNGCGSLQSVNNVGHE